jgi:lipopolysaccharide biosynthesis protein
MNLAKPVRIAALVHLYYDDGFSSIKDNLKELSAFGVEFFFNISSAKDKLLIAEIKKTFPQAFITVSPNKGKDIGGKLVLIDLCMELKMYFDLYILLHDKQSPHSSLGAAWRNKLFRIIQPDRIKEIIQLFDENKKLGIVSSKEFITNEYNSKLEIFDSHNNIILKKLLKQYELSPRSFDFVGGTMYWTRAGIFNSFFEKHAPLTIRASLETGNVMDHEQGTVTHSWERILSWIVLDKGFYIKGISN